MREQRKPQRSRHRQRLPQVRLCNVPELLYAGRTQKTLEAQDTSACQRREVVRVSWHDTAPETHVYVTPAARSGALLLQPVDGGRWRNAIERHVHEGRDAPGRGSTRGVFESFPIGPAGIVDVDVGIDEARKHDVRSKVDLAHTCRPLAVLAHRGDSSVAHNNRRRAKTLRKNDTLASDDKGHRSSLERLMTTRLTTRTDDRD